MRKRYQNEEIDTSQPAVPDTVSVALGELVGELREGLLALAVGAGLQVMAALMEEDVTVVCGPNVKGQLLTILIVVVVGRLGARVRPRALLAA